MKGNQLLNKMSDIDPRLIGEAETYGEKKKTKKKRLFIGWGSGLAAAAAALAMIIGLNATTEPVIDPGRYANLPMISVGSTGISGLGGGTLREEVTNAEYEKIIADFKKEKKETAQYGYKGFETLPVFLSRSNTPDVDQMKARLLEVAATFGFSENELEIKLPDLTQDGYRKLLESQGVPADEIDAEIDRITKRTAHMAEIEAKAEGMVFTIQTNYMVEIRFENPLSLPAGYDLSSAASSEAVGKTVDYLHEKYKGLADYKKPVQIGRSIHNGNSLAEKELESIEFIGWKAGKLEAIRIYTAKGCDKIGDYPILTAKAAEALLKSDKFSGDERMPQDAEIVGVSLEYIDNAPGQTGLLPYYRFVVRTDKTPSSASDVVLDIYTVSAVPEQFIEIDTHSLGVGA